MSKGLSTKKTYRLDYVLDFYTYSLILFSFRTSKQINVKSFYCYKRKKAEYTVQRKKDQFKSMVEFLELDINVEELNV